MLDQLLFSVKTQAMSQLTGAVGMTSDQAEAAVPLAGESVKEGLMGALTSGNISGVTGLLSSAMGSGASSGLMTNPLAAGMMGGLASKLTSKLGLGDGIAKTAAMTIIPMILSKIGGASQEEGDANDLNMSSIISVLGGGGGGLMDKAKGMLGGLMG